MRHPGTSISVPVVFRAAARNTTGTTSLFRIGIGGVSIGSSTCMVRAWKEPRISVVVGLIGAVDFWYDVTRTPPGKEENAKRAALSPRVGHLVSSLDPLERKKAIALWALFLVNGARDAIGIESLKLFTF